MKTLIVAAPTILDFEKTNESIAAKLNMQGIENFTLVNDNEKFYKKFHKIVQVRILKNPEINKAVLTIEKISQFFYKSKYQRFLFTSKIDIKNNVSFNSKILEINELSNKMPPVISDEKELKKFVSILGDKNLYSVLLSSILTQYFITIPKDIDKRFIILSMKEYYRYFYIVKKILLEKKIKSLIIYNGRMLRYSAAYNAALSLGIRNFRFYESTIIDKNSYYLYSKPIHYISNVSKNIKASAFKKKINYELGYRYIGKRFEGGQTGSLVNFQKNRFNKLYAKEWDKFYKDINLGDKKLVSIFTSSEYERNSLEENKRFSGNNIAESLEYLFKKKLFSSDYKLVLRAHPHLKGRDLEYQKLIENICKKYNVFYIPSNSSIDSYKLINFSEICISFGSTISAEASLILKKSISLGKSYYQDFDCVFSPKLVKELNKFLSADLKKSYFIEKQFNALEFFATLNDFAIPVLNDNFYSLEISLFLKKFFIFFLKKFYTTKNKTFNLFRKVFLKKNKEG